MYHVRRPEPRYKFTWDVNVLLAFLETWSPLSSLDMKQLTLKTMALVALTSAQRCQTLAALDVDVMKSNEKGLEFTLKEILKNSKPGKSPVVISLPAFPVNGKLCVHSTFSRYVAKTSHIRQTVGTSKLFLSYGKPYKPVSSSIISRWQESVAGIDTSIFKGHSFRGASTSKAVTRGVSLDDVLKTAGHLCQVL